MTSRPALAGAMIVAAGVSTAGGEAEAGRAPVETPGADVIVDPLPHGASEFLELGKGEAHDDLFLDPIEYDLAQTIFGGDPDDVIATERMVTVTHPTKGLKFRYIVTLRRGIYLDAETRKPVRPPAWALRQLEALK